MSGEFSAEQRRELLNDFYAECDELLTAIRRGLAQWERKGDHGAPGPKAIGDLFRHAHTFKGISAIAGLRPAEELAHGMEEVLRAISKRQLEPSAALADALLTGTQRLEAIVVAHRMGQPLPEIGDLLAGFRETLPAADAAPMPEKIGSEPRPETEPPEDPVAAARSLGRHVIKITFQPSPERAKRGVNVATVRARLAKWGEILTATPVVKGPGEISFEFTIASERPPIADAAWAEDGLAFQAVPVPTPDAESISVTPANIVRVDLARLDELMRVTGELVIHRSRLDERIQQIKDPPAGLREASHALARSLREMRTALNRVRMVPIGELFTRMPLVVRELERNSAKRARVVLDGGQTEIDKYLVERLKEPLLHLVRNAFAHGVEEPAQRAAAHKPAEAVITLSAATAGDSVLVRVADDGGGIDPAQIARRAVELGLPVPAELDARAVLALICSPSFSTREQADLASGRGVGMTVVADTIRQLGGTVRLESRPGTGSTFILQLPLTLSIADAVIVAVGNEKAAIPQSAVAEIVQIPAADVRRINQDEVVPFRTGLLPLVRLQAMFRVPPPVSALLTILVVQTERGSAGLVVDRVIGQREIVIRRLADPLLHLPGLAGATELGDGKPVLILDPGAVTDGVVRPPDASATPDHLQAAAS